MARKKPRAKSAPVTPLLAALAACAAERRLDRYDPERVRTTDEALTAAVAQQIYGTTSPAGWYTAQQKPSLNHARLHLDFRYCPLPASKAPQLFPFI